VKRTAEDPSPQQPSKKRAEEYAEYEKVRQALDFYINS
jgi:hypothetical protein